MVTLIGPSVSCRYKGVIDGLICVDWNNPRSFCGRPIMSCEHQACPRCLSWEGLKFPRRYDPYCEDCGWTDEEDENDE